jgi:hypothetical protein
MYLHNPYVLSCCVGEDFPFSTLNKSRSIERVGYLARIAVMKYVRILAGKHEGKRSFGKYSCKYCNIKIGVNFIYLHIIEGHVCLRIGSKV